MTPSGKPSNGAERLGRPPKLTSENVEALVELVREDPSLSLDDVVWAFRRKTGVSISTATARKYLIEAGFQRSRPKRSGAARGAAKSEGGAAVGEPEAPPKEHGYGEAHRDAGDAARYPCGLTDSEWEQVEHLFDPPGRTGRPPKYPRWQISIRDVRCWTRACTCFAPGARGGSCRRTSRRGRPYTGRSDVGSLATCLRRCMASSASCGGAGSGAIRIRRPRSSLRIRSRPRRRAASKGYDAGEKAERGKRHLVTEPG